MFPKYNTRWQTMSFSPFSFSGRMQAHRYTATTEKHLDVYLNRLKQRTLPLAGQGESFETTLNRDSLQRLLFSCFRDYFPYPFGHNGRVHTNARFQKMLYSNENPAAKALLRNITEASATRGPE